MSISISATTGSWTVSMIDARIPKKVPPFSPERIAPRAFICSGVHEESRIGWPAPCPSCSAPGHQYLNAHLAPSRLTSSKCPCSTIIAAMPSQLPCVGLALKSHGQPGSQLQFFMYGPCISQSAIAPPPPVGIVPSKITDYLRRRDVSGGDNRAHAPRAARPALGAARAGGAGVVRDARTDARNGRWSGDGPRRTRLLRGLVGGDDERDDVPVDRADGADVRLRADAPPRARGRVEHGLLVDLRRGLPAHVVGIRPGCVRALRRRALALDPGLLVAPRRALPRGRRPARGGRVSAHA